jgi:hypothetical protein
MESSSMVSRPGFLICPHCEVGALWLSSHVSARCRSCGNFVSGTMLEALRQLAAIPDESGSHPRECGHPQMRLFPNGAVYCLACWS